MDADEPLQVPLVATAEHGGIYDEASYLAGYECGMLDAYFTFIVSSQPAGAPAYVQQYVRGANVRQADLLAMRHGFAMDTTPLPYGGDEGWVLATFHRNT